MNIEKIDIVSISNKINEVITNWEEDTLENIDKDLPRILNKHKDEIVRKLLGFNKDSWGKWELDHCNGRNGNSPIGERLANKQREIINTWLDNIDISPALLKMEEVVKKELASITYYNFTKRLREKVEKALDKRMEELANEIITKALADIDGQLKLKEFLSN